MLVSSGAPERTAQEMETKSFWPLCSCSLRSSAWRVSAVTVSGPLASSCAADRSRLTSLIRRWRSSLRPSVRTVICFLSLWVPDFCSRGGGWW